MKFTPAYLGYSPEIACEPFTATVPGNIQLDYITAHPEYLGGDINFGENFRKMYDLEPYTWYYKTVIDFASAKAAGEKIWFVTEGIDYIWSLLVDGEEFYTHEGMFSKVELCLDDLLGDKFRDGAVFEIKIHPHPMLEGMPVDRNQASQSVKPPVSYEWDWHPRVIPSGLWDETYFETRTDAHIDAVDVAYRLSDDFKTAEVTVTVDAAVPAAFKLTSPCGCTVFEGEVDGKASFTVENPKLWWCRNLGEPNLYAWEASSAENTVSGAIGFRRIRLVMNEGAWRDPIPFPKSRSVPPAQFELNGIMFFAKGTNYVSQEMFSGTMTAEKYEELIVMAADANMNIFRCWGGSGVQKSAFYDLCDKYGMLVWVEFPLACNNYYDSDHYLAVLEQEGIAIVKKLRRHPSIALWCGGNELFNNWSLMTDQHLALRLLNKITYELSPEIPYNMTSPLSGMKHGGYTFIDRLTGLDQFALFSRSKGTAYTEFGMPGITSYQFIKNCIPEDELFPIERGGSWEAHHAFNAWGKEAWLEYPTLEKYGDVSNLSHLILTTQWLQMMGYKAIFEEARRQRPYCSMAINWCWCEPWMCAVNNSLIGYPNIKKAGYYAVRDSLRDVLGTAKMEKFAYAPGEEFVCEAWLLNDTNSEVSGDLVIWVELDGLKRYLGVSHLTASAQANAKGDKFSFVIPESTASKKHIFVHADLVLSTGEVIRSLYEMVVLG